MNIKEKMDSNAKYGREVNNIINMQNHYIDKETFIKMLNDLNFVSIKSCNLQLITGFKVIEDYKDTQPLYYSIDIE